MCKILVVIPYLSSAEREQVGGRLGSPVYLGRGGDGDRLSTLASRGRSPIYIREWWDCSRWVGSWDPLSAPGDRLSTSGGLGQVGGQLGSPIYPGRMKIRNEGAVV